MERTRRGRAAGPLPSSTPDIVGVTFAWKAGLVATALLGCEPSPAADAGLDGACALDVEIGPSNGSSFVPYGDGDEAEVVLGFQGFQMLRLDVRVAPVDASASLELSAYVLVEDTGVEASRHQREAPVVSAGDAVIADRFLVFFNDAPLSDIGGHDASVEVIARANGCVGGARVTLHLSDRPPCLDPDASVPEAGALDGGLPDGAIVCGVP